MRARVRARTGVCVCVCVCALVCSYVCARSDLGLSFRARFATPDNFEQLKVAPAMISFSNDSLDFKFIIDNAHGAGQQLASIVSKSDNQLEQKMEALELLSESIKKDLD